MWNIWLLLRHLVLCVQADGPGSVSSPYHGNVNNLIHWVTSYLLLLFAYVLPIFAYFLFTSTSYLFCTMQFPFSWILKPVAQKALLWQPSPVVFTINNVFKGQLLLWEGRGLPQKGIYIHNLYVIASLYPYYFLFPFVVFGEWQMHCVKTITIPSIYWCFCQSIPPANESHDLSLLPLSVVHWAAWVCYCLAWQLTRDNNSVYCVNGGMGEERGGSV